MLHLDLPDLLQRLETCTKQTADDSLQNHNHIATDTNYDIRRDTNLYNLPKLSANDSQQKSISVFKHIAITGCRCLVPT
jgi:hypothetical protein